MMLRNAKIQQTNRTHLFDFSDPNHKKEELDRSESDVNIRADIDPKEDQRIRKDTPDTEYDPKDSSFPDEEEDPSKEDENIEVPDSEEGEDVVPDSEDPDEAQHEIN